MRSLLIFGICLGVQSVCLAQKPISSGPLAQGAKDNSVDYHVANTSKIDSDTSVDREKSKPRQAPAGVDVNFLPLFGNFEKTENQLINDEIFRSDCDLQFKTRKEASDFFTKMAWEYLGEGDKNTAINRFNLSYLLQPENVDVYWGLGVIEFQNQNFDSAIDLMSQGLALSDGKNYVFMVDLATVYLTSAFNKSKASLEIENAKTLLSDAIKIKDQYTPAFVQMTVMNILENQIDAAWVNFHKACELNPREVNREVLIELLNRKEDPKGIFKKE